MRTSEVYDKVGTLESQMAEALGKIADLQSTAKQLVKEWAEFREAAAMAQPIPRSELPNLPPCPKIVDDYEYQKKPSDPQSGKADAG